MSKLLASLPLALVACLAPAADDSNGSADTYLGDFQLYSVVQPKYSPSRNIEVHPLTEENVPCDGIRLKVCVMNYHSMLVLPNVEFPHSYGAADAVLVSARYWTSRSDGGERQHGFDVDYALVGALKSTPVQPEGSTYDHYLLKYQDRKYIVEPLGGATGAGEVQKFRVLTADDPTGENATDAAIRRIKEAARNEASFYQGMVLTGLAEAVDGGVRLDVVQYYPFALRQEFSVQDRTDDTPEHP